MIGDWGIVRALRRGAQGEVLLVQREGRSAHALGVLKRVPAEVADDAKRLGRFKHEIEIVREIHHPFIAELLEINLTDRWYVTRFAGLGSLQQHLSLFRGDAWRTLRMARDIALALELAHEKGITHRDVKPGNILLYTPNHVALADFGIAHDPDQTSMTSTDEKVGANWYRPPEAEDGRHEPTPAFDVYMLGKVIYVALTGGRHFRRERFQDNDADIVTMFNRPEFAAVNKLLRNMIVEDTGKRLQSMEAVIDSIDDALIHLYERPRVDSDPRQVFMFGKEAGDSHSGDHPGMQMVPIWLPNKTNRLVIHFRQNANANAKYSLELWSEKTKIFDSAFLKQGRNEVRVADDVGGQWLSLHIRGDSGWGTGLISSLIVHSLHVED
jgi:serine/threonine protein kinase